MNKFIGVGRLTADVNVRYTQNGKCVASFTVAVDSYGEKKADFVPVIAWEKLAETCGNNLGKGRLVLVEGRLQIRSYETKEGQKRTVAEVVAQNVQFLDHKKKDENGYDMNSFGKEVMPNEEVPF